MTKIFMPLCLAVGFATAGAIVAPIPAGAQDCAQFGIGSSAFQRCVRGKAAAVRGAAERKAMEAKQRQMMEAKQRQMMEAQKRQQMEAQKQQQVEAQKRQQMEAQKQQADQEAQRKLQNPGKSDNDF